MIDYPGRKAIFGELDKKYFSGYWTPTELTLTEREATKLRLAYPAILRDRPLVYRGIFVKVKQ